MEKQIRAISIPFSTVKKVYKAGSPRKYWDSGLLAFSNYVIQFTGHFVNDILILVLALAVKVCAVVIKDGSVAFYDIAAVVEQPFQVIMIMVGQQIHETQHILMGEEGRFIIVNQGFYCGQFGAGV